MDGVDDVAMTQIALGLGRADSTYKDRTVGVRRRVLSRVAQTLVRCWRLCDRTLRQQARAESQDARRMSCSIIHL